MDSAAEYLECKERFGSGNLFHEVIILYSRLSSPKRIQESITDPMDGERHFCGHFNSPSSAKEVTERVIRAHGHKHAAHDAEKQEMEENVSCLRSSILCNFGQDIPRELQNSCSRRHVQEELDQVA